MPFLNRWELPFLSSQTSFWDFPENTFPPHKNLINGEAQKQLIKKQILSQKHQEPADAPLQDVTCTRDISLRWGLRGNVQSFR